MQEFFASILNFIVALFAAIPFTSATWFVIAVLGFFVWLFSKAHKDPKSPVNWEHLFVSTETNKTDPYKLGYVVGMIVSTWVVIRFVDVNKLTWDILAGYLTYLLGGAGIAKVLQTKENTAAINKAAAPAKDDTDADK